MDEPDSPHEPIVRRRPWYRWHWTTYIVLLLPLGFWTLLAVPGYSLTSPEISDAGIAHLARLTRLEHLEIEAPISDAALKHLKGLKRLNYLKLDDENLTDDAVRDLQRALPGLPLIEYDGGSFWEFSDHVHTRPFGSGCIQPAF